MENEREWKRWHYENVEIRQGECKRGALSGAK